MEMMKNETLQAKFWYGILFIPAMIFTMISVIPLAIYWTYDWSGLKRAFEIWVDKFKQAFRNGRCI